jgi:hypothetical protein
MSFATDTKVHLLDSNFYYCFLDEKWFYIKSKRNKYKFLPPGPGETIEDAFVKPPKEHSRRFPLKVMFMGVVAPPNEENEFDGKIFLKRISRKEVVKKITYCKNFHEDYYINKQLKKGEWMLCYIPGMTVENLFEQIEVTFDLDKPIMDRLVLTYHNASPKSIKKNCLSTIQDQC